MKPSEVLSRAADLIRDRAAAATPGPWSVDNPDYVETISAEDGTAVVAGGRWGGEASVFNDSADARWIALMSPAVAADLSQLLVALESRDYDAARVIAHCLARAVLGQKEDSDG